MYLCNPSQNSHQFKKKIYPCSFVLQFYWMTEGVFHLCTATSDTNDIHILHWFPVGFFWVPLNSSWVNKYILIISFTYCGANFLIFYLKLLVVSCGKYKWIIHLFSYVFVLGGQGWDGVSLCSSDCLEPVSAFLMCHPTQLIMF